jgi:hypothetical protein
VIGEKQSRPSLVKNLPLASFCLRFQTWITSFLFGSDALGPSPQLLEILLGKEAITEARREEGVMFMGDF